MITQNLKTKILQLQKRNDEISTERKKLLEKFAANISEKVKDNKNVNLTFICTHNSRRSHMSQIWAQTAAEYYGIPKVKCFSGGTEATAFNPRAVKAIRKFGFEIQIIWFITQKRKNHCNVSLKFMMMNLILKRIILQL